MKCEAFLVVIVNPSTSIAYFRRKEVYIVTKYARRRESCHWRLALSMQKTKSPADNLPRGDLDSFELNDLHWSAEMTVTTVTTVTKGAQSKHSAVHFLLPAGT